jgi:hypothetical protein
MYVPLVYKAACHSLPGPEYPYTGARRRKGMFTQWDKQRFRETHLWDPPILRESTVYDGSVNLQRTSWVGHILAAGCTGSSVLNDGIYVLTATRYPI